MAFRKTRLCVSSQAMNQEQNPQPICISVIGTLSSLWRAVSVALCCPMVSMKLKWLMLWRIPTTASWKGNTFSKESARTQPSYRGVISSNGECFLHWKWKHENSPGQGWKSCTCSSSSVFDVTHIWMTTVTASSAVSKYSSQQALLTILGQQRRQSLCAGDNTPVCHLPMQEPPQPLPFRVTPRAQQMLWVWRPLLWNPQVQKASDRAKPCTCLR